MPIKAKLADKSKPILSLGKNFNLEPSGHGLLNTRPYMLHLRGQN